MVSSWCNMSSPLHGKVRGAFDGLGICLMVHVYVSLSHVAWCDSCVCSTMSKYSSMRSLSIPFVLAPCSIHVPVSTITHDNTNQIQKSPSLPWWSVFCFAASDRERDKALKLRDLFSIVSICCVNINYRFINMCLLISFCTEVSLAVCVCKQVNFLKFKMTFIRKIASKESTEHQTFKVQRTIKETL